MANIFSLDDYIAGTKVKKSPVIPIEEEQVAYKMPEIELDEYKAPERPNLPTPDLFQTPAVVKTDMPHVQPKPTPVLAEMPTMQVKAPNLELTLPGGFDKPSQGLPQASVSAPQQSIVKQEVLIPNEQQTSPTQADKAFNAPRVPIKDKTLELPPEWTQKDVEKVEQLAKDYGVTKEEMFGIMYHETAGQMSPKTKNAIGATGLIQFTKDTAADLLLSKKQLDAVTAARLEAKERGLSKEAEEANIAVVRKQNPLYWQLSDKDKARAKDLAQKAVENMSVSDQLDLKGEYLKQRTKGSKGLENVYTSIFAGNPKETVIMAGSKAYEANKYLDKDGKGGITREEWLAPVMEKAAAIKDIKLATNKPDKASGTIEMRTIPVGQVATDADKQRVVDDAKNMILLAKPGLTKAEVEEAVQRAPINITDPGTPEDDYMKKEDAFGLHWKNEKNGKELIEVTSNIPRSAATGVVAHEIAHTLPKYGHSHSSGKGEITSSDANWMLEGGRPAILEGALKEGGRKLDAEFEKEMFEAEQEDVKRLKEKAPWLPDWAIPYIIPSTGKVQKPSEAANINLMKKTSGPAPQDSRWWETEYKDTKKKP